jgi:hypothetical protein
MHRNVTAIYRTHAIADEVRREVERLGIPGRHVHVLPDHDDSGTIASERDESAYRSDLDHLGLPDDDRHTYDRALRRGDYVVSVRVNEGESDHLGRITEIMRHPEAHDFDTLDRDFADEPRGAHNAGPGTPTGRRDSDYDYGGSTLRGFTYDDPYVPPRERV